MTPDTLNPKTTIKKVEKTEKTSKGKDAVLEVSGLCVTCTSAETCMYRKNATSAIHYCEEFDDSRNVTVTKLRHTPPTLTPREEYKAPTGMKGLCVNCEHVNTCEHAKTQGGVWHCENYL